VAGDAAGFEERTCHFQQLPCALQAGARTTFLPTRSPDDPRSETRHQQLPNDDDDCPTCITLGINAKVSSPDLLLRQQIADAYDDDDFYAGITRHLRDPTPETLAKVTRPTRDEITRYELDGDLLTYVRHATRLVHSLPCPTTFVASYVQVDPEIGSVLRDLPASEACGVEAGATMAASYRHERVAIRQHTRQLFAAPKQTRNGVWAEVRLATPRATTPMHRTFITELDTFWVFLVPQAMNITRPGNDDLRICCAVITFLTAAYRTLETAQLTVCIFSIVSNEVGL
jgi:hypothetical protein